MDVLHINRHLERKGGVETYLLSLLPQLQDRGVRSTWAYETGNSDLYEPSLAIPELGGAGFQYQRSARDSVTGALEVISPDLIHIHNVQNIGVLQACLEYGPTVITTHDYRWVCPANSFFYKRTKEVCDRTCGLGCFATTLTKHCLTPRPQYAAYYYYRAKWAIGRAEQFATVIAPSQGAKSRMRQAGFSEENLYVLPYFCPLEPAENPRSQPSRPTITYIGRIAPNKGHKVFVRALGLLPDDVRGIMVGSITPEDRSELYDLADRHGCSERLDLRSWASREEVVRILDNTSVFIFPSLWPETLGIVGLEALSRGVPVVASNLGGVSEWLRDDKNGYLVPPKDPEAIREAVSSLLEDEYKLTAFGREGIRTIKDGFLPSTHTNALVHLYRRSIDAAVDPVDHVLE